MQNKSSSKIVFCTRLAAYSFCWRPSDVTNTKCMLIRFLTEALKVLILLFNSSEYFFVMAKGEPLYFISKMSITLSPRSITISICASFE